MRWESDKKMVLVWPLRMDETTWILGEMSGEGNCLTKTEGEIADAASLWKKQRMQRAATQEEHGQNTGAGLEGFSSQERCHQCTTAKCRTQGSSGSFTTIILVNKPFEVACSPG